VIIVESQAVGPFFKNGFVVACPRTQQGVLIDPGDEVDGLLAFAVRERIAITAILLTHAHVDHVTGVGAAKRALQVPVCLHRDDLFLYDRALDQARMFGLRVDTPPPPIDRFYTADDRFVFGDFEAAPHHTPGHCPGGVCLAVHARHGGQAGRAGQAEGSSGSEGWDLFVGDTLFAGSIGRTDLPGGDYATLIGSIRTVLFAFGDEARVYPGHGPATTIGQERRTNPFLQADAARQ
jgi:glyoxylase-like metal-dependent hydrolase (beta-lactamase superfamily II)